LKHLIFSEWTGTQATGPAIPSAIEKPFALNDKGQVVYSSFEPRDAGPKLAKFKLVPYTDAVQKERRALAETVLGHYALTTPAVAQAAIDKVSDGIRTYWEARKKQLHQSALEFSANEGDKYLAGATSFGRLNLNGVQKWTEKVDRWMDALNSTPRDLPKIMNIHDNFLRIFRVLGPSDLPEPEHRWVRQMPVELRHAIMKTPVPEKSVLEKETRARFEILKRIIPESFGWSRSAQWVRMQGIAEQVRPESLFDPKFRGRKDLSGFKPTDRPGLMPEVSTINAAETVKRLGLTLEGMKTAETRVRGMDRYEPQMETMAPVFADAIRQYNLNFGAGPSGTTGTLFTSAIGFARIEGEDLKKYLMGCIAYLVAGGMHTCHEVFTTFNLLFPSGKGPYQGAKYDACLPADFKSTKEFDAWKVEFYDIAG
jgi:hypothetical protein